MFKLFSKSKTDSFVAPVDGTLLPLEEVQDPVFSEKIMGDGYAVAPSVNMISAPVDGTIQSIFPTNHALTLLTANGLEVILHIGLDTVELNGAPFTRQVHEGQTVTAGTPLISMDRDAVTASGKQTTVIVVITNMDKVASFPVITSNTVVTGDPVANIKLKA